MAEKDELKIQKVTKEELRTLQTLISKRSDAEKDFLLASLYLSTQRMVDIIRYLLSKADMQLTKKEEREIEDSISVGPSWLNYSKKVKRKK